MLHRLRSGGITRWLPMEEVDVYRGFHQPPTEEEYRRLWEERDDGDY